ISSFSAVSRLASSSWPRPCRPTSSLTLAARASSDIGDWDVWPQAKPQSRTNVVTTVCLPSIDRRGGKCPAVHCRLLAPYKATAVMRRNPVRSSQLLALRWLAAATIGAALFGAAPAIWEIAEHVQYLDAPGSASPGRWTLLLTLIG